MGADLLIQCLMCFMMGFITYEVISLKRKFQQLIDAGSDFDDDDDDDDEDEDSDDDDSPPILSRDYSTSLHRTMWSDGLPK